MKTGIFKERTRKDGLTCSWCKLVGKGDVEAVKLTQCSRCWRARKVKISYCGRRCQAQAWKAHRVECASSCWSLAQHRHHSPGTKRYVSRLTNEVMIHTVMWRREPSFAKQLYVTRVLPYLLSYDMRMPRLWVTDLSLFSPQFRRYVSRLTTEVASSTLMWRRESNIARKLWEERILPFLLDYGSELPAGWATPPTRSRSLASGAAARSDSEPAPERRRVIGPPIPERRRVIGPPI